MFLVYIYQKFMAIDSPFYPPVIPEQRREKESKTERVKSVRKGEVTIYV